MVRKSSTCAGLLLLLTALLANLSLVQADSHCEFADETIKFGAFAPLSAPGAVVAGVVVDWAVKQAEEDINAECGIHINGANYRLEVITGDTEGISERGQSVAERFIFDEGIHGAVAGFHSAVALAAMSILQENQIPTVWAGPWNDNVTANGIMEFEGRSPRINDGVDYIFRISPAWSMVGSVVADWLISLGVDDVIIMAENTDFGQPAAADEKARLEAAGMRVTQYNVELGTEDFVPILSRIESRPEPADAIHIIITGDTSLNLNQQMAELGIAPSPDTICIAGYDAEQSTQFWDSVEDGNYCAFNRTGVIPTLFSEMGAELNRKYEAYWDDTAPSFAMEPYDSVLLMANAIERAGTFTDPDAIVAALETSDVELTQGRYYFEYGSHNPDLPAGIPAFMWHQWPAPIVTVMQYFEQGQSSLDAAVVYPPVYQTHGATYIQPGTSP
ncbi:MAG: ABC transporter substrate-binding protein [Chloroflexi bacterium]|nr:ABC transporter substrate-binding protein [Chloroflexota bacterium]